MATAVFQVGGGRRPRWMVGEGHCGVIEARAREVEEVRGAMEAVEEAARGGLWAAGFVSYEAAAGLDGDCVTHELRDWPLVRFDLYREMRVVEQWPLGSGEFDVVGWDFSEGDAEYRAKVARIREWIAAGDTYQVNYTIRRRCMLRGRPEALFARLWENQRAPHSAYIDSGDWAICSASPELFFELEGTRLVSRPMKGTRRRGLWPEQDQERQRELENSAKDRAENVMIVDMIRNDMGRVARMGSVRVARAMEIERYPTVLQMTSTVECQTDAGVAEIFTTMFPCASITGAPKLRTMQIIRDLETGPRGVYTGSIGWIGPDRRARFNVAIRTVAVKKSTGEAEYGVGGGIVWDSDAGLEWAECAAKAEVLSTRRPEFELLETMRFEPGKGEAGYWLLEEHLARLAASAEYFDWEIDLAHVRDELARAAKDVRETSRVRLRLGRNGNIAIEATPLPPAADRPWRIRLAREPVDTGDFFLYHKTTRREVYERALATRGDCDDVLLWNERKEVTETAIANIVVELDGEKLTPPVESGLLAGVPRGHLLATGQIRERVVTIEDLGRCTRAWAINSVRGWMEAEIVGQEMAHP